MCGPRNRDLKSQAIEPYKASSQKNGEPGNTVKGVLIIIDHMQIIPNKHTEKSHRIVTDTMGVPEMRDSGQGQVAGERGRKRKERRRKRRKNDLTLSRVLGGNWRFLAVLSRSAERTFSSNAVGRFERPMLRFSGPLQDFRFSFSERRYLTFGAKRMYMPVHALLTDIKY